MLLSVYHYLLGLLGCIIYGNPSKNIKIVAVTGTKGKTTVVELVSSVLREAGHIVASSSSSHMIIGDRKTKNLSKTSTPGRFFLQHFLHKAIRANCDWVVIEMTSQAVLQHRHTFISLDALLFTNIAPEHIDAHGSFQNYLSAKLELAKHVSHSKKRPRTIVANLDDEHGREFLNFEAENLVGFSKKDAGTWHSDQTGTALVLDGIGIKSRLPGEFNLYNILATATFAKTLHIEPAVIGRGVEKVTYVEGRMESLPTAGNLGIKVIIDYAHTKDSFDAVYKLFGGQPIISVFGSTGGGRDKWKRSELGAISEKYCSRIILTNDDPHNEDPKLIVADIISGITDKSKVVVEIDRRKAINMGIKAGLELKAPGITPVILLLGYGTYPYMTGPDGKQETWNEKKVAEEELSKFNSADL